MWEKINSPIIITILVVASLFVLKYTFKPLLATEIRGAYDELVSIAKNATSDAEKTKAVQKFAEEITSQLKSGIKRGVDSGNEKKEDKNKVFIETKNKIMAKNIKAVKSDWKNKEKYLFSLKNNSGEIIEDIKLNYEYYKNGKLIDVDNDRVNGLKFLEPGHEFAISIERSLPEENGTGNYSSDELKIIISSFDIVELK